jgi:Zn-dependent protease with chaperone function
MAAPSSHRASTALEEPPGEASNRARPTATWSYRWLSLGSTAGTAAGLGIAAGATWFSTSVLHATSPTWVLVGVLAYAAANGAVPFFKGLLGNRALTEHYEYSSDHTRHRVKETTDLLCREAVCQIPTVVASSRIQNMAMFDGPKGANVLLYNPNFVERLTNRELQGIIAHELSHADRFSTGARILLGSAGAIAHVTTLAATLSYCLAAGDGTLLSAALAVAGAKVLRVAMHGCKNIASRAEEIRTDIRAVELTGDMGSLLSSLRTAYD